MAETKIYSPFYDSLAGNSTQDIFQQLSGWEAQSLNTPDNPDNPDTLDYDTVQNLINSALEANGITSRIDINGLFDDDEGVSLEELDNILLAVEELIGEDVFSNLDETETKPATVSEYTPPQKSVDEIVAEIKKKLVAEGMSPEEVEQFDSIIREAVTNALKSSGGSSNNNGSQKNSKSEPKSNSESSNTNDVQVTVAIQPAVKGDITPQGAGANNIAGSNGAKPLDAGVNQPKEVNIEELYKKIKEKILTLDPYVFDDEEEEEEEELQQQAGIVNSNN